MLFRSSTLTGEYQVAILPTRVGMNRKAGVIIGSVIDTPHSRGDEPTLGIQVNNGAIYSPLAWG